ncbi:methyl-accepting chemotaxis protein [Desulfobaculum sp.]
MRLNFNKKLISGILLTVAVLLGTQAAVNLYQSQKALTAFGQEFLKNTTTEVVHAARMQDESMNMALRNEVARFSQQVKDNMGFWLSKNDVETMNVINQKTMDAERVDIPSLRLSDTTILNDTSIVDRIHDMSGFHATIFQVLPGKLVRVSTSITKDDGTRAVGTYIPEDSPVYQTVMNGETYYGRARVLGKEYITAYAPATDYGGNVVAVLFVGTEIMSPHMQSMLGEISVAGRGYAFVSDSNGHLLYCPEDRELDFSGSGKDVWRAISSARDSIVTFTNNGRERVGFVKYFAPWDWLVVVSIAKDSMMLGMDRTLMLVSLGVVGIGLVAAALFTVLLLRRLLRPLDELSSVTQRIASGDLNARSEYDGDDAIGRTVSSVNAMVLELKNKLGFAEGVLKGITLPCSVVSAENEMVFINDEKIRLMEFPGTPEDYYGKTSGEFFFHDAARETLAMKSMDQGKRLSADIPMTTTSGREFQINSTCTPIHDLDGNPIGALVIWFDLTDMKRQEEEIRKQHERMAEAARLADRVAEQVSSASEELAAQIDESNQGSGEQLRRTAEAATAMEQMNASVLEVARNAGSAAELVDGARGKADEGAHIVSEMASIIDAVAERSESLKSIMGELGDQAEGIGRIMDVISDIADQTNLLALNAAIEAARAGDAGRGFAVVADEVRKLAEKTMSATREVAVYIESIQTSARRSLESTEETVSAVQETTERAGQSGRSLQEIVSMVQSGADQVRAIATAAEEQSSASEQINRSTEEINSIASENADAMAQSTEAVAELARLAVELKNITADMRE